MKATGIVRRIDEWGIITPRAVKPHKHWVFAVHVQTIIEKVGGFKLEVLVKHGVEIHNKSRMRGFVHPVFYLKVRWQITEVFKYFCHKYYITFATK